MAGSQILQFGDRILAVLLNLPGPDAKKAADEIFIVKYFPIEAAKIK